MILSLFLAGIYAAQETISTPPTLSSFYTTSPPTIDGTLSPGEWSNGVSIALNGFDNPANVIYGTLYIMNNNTHIFVALVINDSSDNALDWAMLDFDPEHDHAATLYGEDAMDYYSGACSDYYWDGSWWTSDLSKNGTFHGTCTRVHSGSQYVYEYVKPLNSGESLDMAVVLGDILGFRIEIWDQASSDNYRYPPDTVDSVTSRWNEWADLTVVTSSTTTVPATTSTSSTTSTTTTTTTTTTTSTTSSTTTTLTRVAENLTANLTANTSKEVNGSTVNVSLTVEANSDVSDARVQVTEYAGNPESASFTTPGLGRYFAFEPNSALANQLTAAYIRFYYTDAELAAAGLTTDQLAIHWYNTSLSVWQRMDALTMAWVYGTGVDSPNKFVWANVSHFSTYTIAAGTQEHTASLATGWNLISLPIEV
ncbi:MAG: hypothetical protein ABH834_00330 [Candidatus Altiarchaeota archaeon]